jgi:hypothetical protein
VAIGKVLLQLMDARTFVGNHNGIKTGDTEDVQRFDIAILPGAAGLAEQGADAQLLQPSPDLRRREFRYL